MARDLILAIEASNPSASTPGHLACAVALGSLGGHTLGVEPILGETRGDADLVPAIDRLFARCGARPKDLARVAVSLGPGGYTAVRIAAATGTMIALGAGAERIAVPTSLVVARSTRTSGPFAVLLAWKPGSVHATRFDADGRQSAASEVIAPEDLRELGSRTLIADHHLGPEFVGAAAALGVAIRPPSFDPEACLALGRELAPGRALTPIYAREPDAVTQWRNRVPR